MTAPFSTIRGYDLRLRSRSPVEERSTSRPKHRKILPLGETPSLTRDESVFRVREIDPEVTELKVAQRITVYLTDGVLQEVTKSRQARGKTHLQGAQGSRRQKTQAAHHCLCPTLEDDLTRNLREKVMTGKLTPKKSEPYLRARLSLGSPEMKDLREHSQDGPYVDRVFKEHLPPGGDRSSLAGTHYEKFRNATFENPDESNQVDCYLEAHLKPKLVELESERAEGKITVEESTYRLISAMMEFYDIFIPGINKRLEQLKAFNHLEQELMRFETLYKTEENIPRDLFNNYLENVCQFIALKDEFLLHKTSVPKWSEVKNRRQDFYYLEKLAKGAQNKENSRADLLQYFKVVRPYLKTPKPPIRIEQDQKHFELLLEEATLQRKVAAEYHHPEMIHRLFVMTFGVSRGPIRETPKKEELDAQVAGMLMRSPVKSSNKKKRREPIEPSTRLPAAGTPVVDYNLVKRRLDF